MPRDFQTGAIVVEIATGKLWKVLYHDEHLQIVTCEHTGSRHFIVRAIKVSELRLARTQGRDDVLDD